MKALLEFLKYNNAVPFILFAIMLGAGTALAASPKLRQAVFAPEVAMVTAGAPVKTDVSRLVAENMKTFDLALRIDALTENTANYYVSYSYRTLEVVGASWQEVRKNGKMDIPKQLLGKRDLKDYLSEQLGQVMNREMAYLSEAQMASRAAAVPGKSSKYAALVGQEIEKSTSPSGKSVAGNGIGARVSEQTGQRVVAEKEESPVEALLSKEEIRQIIVAAVAEFLAIDTSMPDTVEEPIITEEGIPVPEEIPVMVTPEEPVLEDEPAEEVSAP